jgi:hypothetical protein
MRNSLGYKESFFDSCTVLSVVSRNSKSKHFVEAQMSWISAGIFLYSETSALSNQRRTTNNGHGLFTQNL